MDPLVNRAGGALSSSPEQSSTTCVRIPADLVRQAVLDPSVLDPFLHIPGECLAGGDAVAFPTETVYGLGADATRTEAVGKIFQAKKRPADNPLIVHVSSEAMLEPLVAAAGKEDVRRRELGWGDRHDRLARELMAKFWPGPLTLLFPASSAVPAAVTAGLGTVGIRMPAHPVARRLIHLAGVPVAAPSANISGRPSPTVADDVLADLQGRVSMVVDGGPCTVGVESTVLSLIRDPPMVLRPGGITLEELREIIPNVELYCPEESPVGESETPAAPGLKYRHYAPEAKVVVLEFGGKESGAVTAGKAAAMIGEEIARGQNIAVLTTRRAANYPDGAVVMHLGDDDKPEDAARNLFHLLRTLGHQVDTIYVESVPDTGAGIAVMNRLRKAASSRIHVQPSANA